MPKATLTFNLPKEQTEFDTALRGAVYKTILWNLDQMLRSHIKHGDYDPATKAAYQTVRDSLHHDLQEFQVDIQ